MRVQVVYGSRHGGTAGLAHMIANAFEREGWQATVTDVAQRPGVADVDAVVVGGALYFGRWPAPLRQWVRQHAPALRSVPVWFFSSGPLDASARDGSLAPVAGVTKLAAEIEIAGHETFGGYLDAHPDGILARRMARTSAGDWRDPEHVAEWVHFIVRKTAVRAEVPVQRTAEAAPARTRRIRSIPV